MPVKRTALFLAAAAAVALSAPAQAASTVATLSNYGYQLIDMDTNDGIDPSIAFTWTRTTVSASVAEVAGGGLTSNQSFTTYDTANVLAHNEAATGGTVAALQDGTLQAMGSLGGVDTFYAQTLLERNFTLSANTRLVFTATAFGASDFGTSYPDNFGSATITATILDNQFTGPYNQVAHFSGGVDTYVTGVSSYYNAFSLTFTNDSGAALDGRINLTASAYGSVSPVPEPSSWLMLGTGLLVAGAVARRARG